MHATSWARSVVAASLWAALGAFAAAQTRVTDLDGRPVEPLDGHAAATVLIFTAVDCPISNRYAPVIRRLAERHGSHGVRVWLVYANADERRDAASAHAESFAYGLPVAFDPAGALADRAQATVTPDAAVFDASGRLRYHGRIDDRYVDFGLDRPAPTRHDLDDAVAAVIAGTPVALGLPSVGCAIVRRP